MQEVKKSIPIVRIFEDFVYYLICEARRKDFLRLTLTSMPV